MNSIDRIISVQTEYYPGSTPTLWVRVRAIVEDMVLVHKQTMYDPEEWGPAECVMEFTVDDYEDDLVMSEKSIMELIQHYGPEWELCDDDT